MARFNRWENSTPGQGEDRFKLRKIYSNVCNFSVFREGDAMADGLKELKEIRRAPCACSS